MTSDCFIRYSIIIMTVLLEYLNQNNYLMLVFLAGIIIHNGTQLGLHSKCAGLVVHTHNYV